MWTFFSKPFNSELILSHVPVPGFPVPGFPKLYFVPVETIDEARYLAGILNAPTVGSAIAAYAAQLSLGVSVIDNLKLPAFDPDDDRHRELAQIAAAITARNGEPADNELQRLDELAYSIVSQHH